MNFGKVLSLVNKRNDAWIHSDDMIIYCHSDSEHRIVPNQQVSFNVENLTDIDINDIEVPIPQYICALLTTSKLFAIDCSHITSKSIDKQYAILCGRLCISSKTRWGVTSKGLHKYTFRPRDNAYPTYIVASKLKPSQVDVYVRVEIQAWDDKDAHPKASLVDILGEVTNRTVYEDVILASQLVLPRNRNTIHRSETKKYEGFIEPDFIVDEDWSDTLTVSIDPEGSKDIDDAISIRDVNGTVEYAVHIATPTIWFEKDSPLDEFASSQVTSIYTDTTTHHLLPKILSTNKASLLENEERFCLSVIWSVGKSRIVRTKIINKHTYSYDQSETTTDYQKIHSAFKELFGINPHDSHILVEQSMIKANMCVAEYIVENSKSTALLRKTVLNSAWYLNWTENSPNSHESLEADLYTHFTSPLRRYADQLVHRQLFALLSGNPAMKPSNESIVHMNIVKTKTKTVDSQMKWIQLANPNSSTTLHGKILYFHDGLARVELPDKDNMRISVPLMSYKINDIVTTQVTEDGLKVKLEYPNCEYPLEIEAGDTIIELHWNQYQGLEGFRFEWIQPSISEWLSYGSH